MSHPNMLVPVAPIAPRVLLPDDPGVALKLATSLLDDDRLMANHHRGLWGYSGSGRDGLGPLTIQSTGVGAASAGLVFTELVAAGVTVAVRIGTGRGGAAGPAPGSLYAVTGVGDALTLDDPLTGALTLAATASGPVTSIDPHDDDQAHETVTDLESNVLARQAQHHGTRFASILAISAAGGHELDHEEVAAAVFRAGVAAGQALGNA